MTGITETVSLVSPVMLSVVEETGVLIGHAPLDADAGRDLTDCLLAAGNP
jgi:hypothetical protein